MKNSDFYNGISAFYDDMIGFDASLVNKTKLLGTMLAGYNIETAADIGCGTGLDSLALASLGYKVKGFDISKKMIEIAKQNARKKKLKPEFIDISSGKINKSEYGKYDLVVSLGNALANMDENILESTIKVMFSMLKNQGLIILQLLNYEKIMKEKPVVIGMKESCEKTITRYYEYEAKDVNFNILAVDKANISKSTLVKTKIYPYRKSHLSKKIKEAGFTGIQFYGSLKLEKYLPDSSNDLVIIAYKNSNK